MSKRRQPSSSSRGTTAITIPASFFKRRSSDWSIIEYLESDHAPELTPRMILDAWKKSLEAISGGSYTADRRTRATVLLERYHEKGNGSDKQVGKNWLDRVSPAPRRKKAKTSVLETAPASGSTPVPQSVHYGHVFQGTVSGSAFGGDVNNSKSSEATVPAQDHAVDDEEATLVDVSEAEDEPQILGTKADFEKSYQAMKDAYKWTLSTGRAVEDVIYEGCLAMNIVDFNESLGRSFVVDLTSDAMKSWFTKDEWDEIVDAMPKMPSADPLFVDSIKRFIGVSTCDQLRETLRKTTYLPDNDSDYDPALHWDSEWADTVVRFYLKLFESRDKKLRASHLEDWFTSNVWAPVVDSCMVSLPDVSLERKESTCQATGARKNRGRRSTSKGRAKSGPRLDAVIRTVEDHSFEYGGIEVAKTFNGGETSSKWLGDALKLCKALRDMIYVLHKRVHHDAEVARVVQVVGIVNAGLHLQVLRMVHPKGYICLLQRERTHSVPTCVEDINDLLLVLSEMTKVKKVVARCIAKVDGRKSARNVDDVVKDLLHGSKELEETLFWAADSP